MIVTFKTNQVESRDLFRTTEQITTKWIDCICKFKGFCRWGIKIVVITGGTVFVSIVTYNAFFRTLN